MMNGSVTGVPNPTPTPVPSHLSATNGDIPVQSPLKSGKWTGTDKDMIEIQKTKAAIGLNPKALSNTYNGNDINHVKFISLASPLVNGIQTSGYVYQNPRTADQANVALQSLPMKPTLHIQKQIPGRFFPSPSYTEFQRDVLESRPTPRRIIRKFKPNNGKSRSLFPAGSPVKPKTAVDKSTWIATQVYNRGSLMQPASDKVIPLLAPDIDNMLAQNRQYSIPATTIFHDGNNDALVMGSGVSLFNKGEAVPDTAPHNTAR